jgi:hypothetical protein
MMEKQVKKTDFKEDVKSDKGLNTPLKNLLTKTSNKKTKPKK